MIAVNKDNRLFSYVVARDYGFAPNPFFGMCTLACCKPLIRKAANIGDWVVGTGSKQKNRRYLLVYAMRVSGTMTFNEYWEDDRFQRKKPNLRGSKKQAFGDNIYFKDELGKWHQLNSHHSYEGGSPNQNNVLHDTKIDRVLISTNYAYWGGEGPNIRQKFENCCGSNIYAEQGQGHKCKFPTKFVEKFAAWFCSLNEHGNLGRPLDWKHREKQRSLF